MSDEYGQDLDGERYVTTTEACRLLAPDVTPALIQDWVRRGILTPVGRYPGRANVFRWGDVVRAEYVTQAQRRGRPRARSLQEIDMSGTISDQTKPMEAAQIRVYATRCTVTKPGGRDCDRAVPEDAPITVCLPHMLEAANFYRDYTDARHDKNVERAKNQLPELFQPPRPPAAPQRIGVIYYIRFDGRIKIGQSSNLRQRLKSLPYDELLAVEPGDVQLERLRHTQFAGHRITGEWFAPAEDLLSHIAMLVGHYGPPSGPEQ